MRALSIAVMALAVSASVAQAVTTVTAADRNVLHGLRTVNVMIESMDDAALEAGFSPEQYRKDTESRLQKAGIHVLTASEVKANNSPVPCLYLRVGAMLQPEVRLAVYSVDLELLDAVFLERAPTTLALGSTWRAQGQIGKLGTDRIGQVRGTVKDAVDEFITAWSVANSE